ncbi:MAG TPA: alpha/beta hydrolase, partial [Polyangiaceae bacterium]|nr:alpha/beta hydrolase [Polyangiaceae bacterium]
MKIPVPGAELHAVAADVAPNQGGAEQTPCLVLCNIGSRPFQLQLAALAEQLPLVFVDLRGSGQSTGVASELSLDVLAQDLDAVREHLGVSRVALFGHSIVGALAIEAARRLPERVSHVIAVGTPPHADMSRLTASGNAFFEQDASPERKRALARNLAQLPEDPRARTPAQMMLAQTPQRFFDPDFDAASLYAGAQINFAFFAHLLGKLTSGWDVLAGPALGVPLFLALGRHDYTVPYTSWNGILEQLPRATLHLFERSGHQ